MARPEPRRRRDAQILYRRFFVGPGQSDARYRTAQRTAPCAQRSRARRVRSKRRLHMRRAAAWTRTDHSLCDERFGDELRECFAGRIIGGNELKSFSETRPTLKQESRAFPRLATFSSSSVSGGIQGKPRA